MATLLKLFPDKNARPLKHHSKPRRMTKAASTGRLPERKCRRQIKSPVRILAALTILSLSVACAGGSATPTAVREPDYWPTEGWKSSTPSGPRSPQILRG